MKFKVNGVAYTSIRKNSLAWYLGKTLKAIGYLINALVYIVFVLLVCFLMIALG